MMTKEKRLAGLMRQIGRLERQIGVLKRQSEQLTAVRLLLFLLGGVGSGILFITLGAAIWAITFLPFFLPFALSVAYHRRVEKGLRRLEAWLLLKRRHLARATLDWTAIPPAETAPVPPDHPFAYDFDLIGERSLQRLLNTAVSHEGSIRLQTWLLDPLPDPAAMLARQTRVRELVAKPLFRDKLTLHGLHLVGKRSVGEMAWPGQQLLDWLDSGHSDGQLGRVLPLLAGLTAVNFLLLAGNLLAGWPAWWVWSWTAYGVLFFAQSRQVQGLFKEAWFVETRLGQLTAVFSHLEQFAHPTGSALADLCAPFQQSQERPSQQLRHVRRIAAAAGLQHNPMLWLLLNFLLPWDLYFAYRLQQAKRQLAHSLPHWLDSWYELEALSSLATFAYLNPATTFPQLQPEKTGYFATQKLAHPLIPADERVGNDFCVDNLGSLFILTGSNMSGKSSFLRTMGVNLCLAYAGGAVVAQSLDTSLFRLFAAIRVNDSVVDGFSYFYAEVRRLRALLDALAGEERPLFFFIDEIFRGTNNRERLQGSRAYIQTLVGKNGVGFIATHDLELVRLAEGQPLIQNLHFRDEVKNGRMIFDYTLRPGPSPTTNALKIMRLAGLPVEDGIRD